MTLDFLLDFVFVGRTKNCVLYLPLPGALIHAAHQVDQIAS